MSSELLIPEMMGKVDRC